jgi:hypothetical protein
VDQVVVGRGGVDMLICGCHRHNGRSDWLTVVDEIAPLPCSLDEFPESKTASGSKNCDRTLSLPVSESVCVCVCLSVCLCVCLCLCVCVPNRWNEPPMYFNRFSAFWSKNVLNLWRHHWAPSPTPDVMMLHKNYLWRSALPPTPSPSPYDWS